jgi:hypothetical protein
VLQHHETYDKTNRFRRLSSCSRLEFTELFLEFLPWDQFTELDKLMVRIEHSGKAGRKDVILGIINFVRLHKFARF